MSFGLTNALASFQQFINKVLGEYLDIFIIAYCYEQSHDAAHVTDRHDHWISIYDKYQHQQKEA